MIVMIRGSSLTFVLLSHAKNRERGLDLPGASDPRFGTAGRCWG